MALTKKHFEMIARRIKQQVEGIRTTTTTITSRPEKDRALARLNDLACDMAFDFRRENENFDESRFIKACGF